MVASPQKARGSTAIASIYNCFKTQQWFVEGGSDGGMVPGVVKKRHLCVRSELGHFTVAHPIMLVVVQRRNT